MMSGFFRRLPIRHKLVMMIMLTSSSVLLLASIGYIGNDYYRTRSGVREDLTSQARLVLENSTAAIDFMDAKAADEILRTLAPDTHIRLACLYTGDGRLLTSFRGRTALRPCPAAPPPDGFEFSSTRLELVASAEHNGRRSASVLLRSDLEELTARLRVQITIVMFLLMVSLAVALVLSARVQAIVSEPIVALASTARQVSSHGDYSLRAQRTTEDELGVLVDAFNSMLQRIETREAELSRANDELRREVAERRRAEQARAELLVREREANRLKDEFLATLSHELRTPLNAILGWTRLLRAKALPEEATDVALEKVERNAQVQTRLVEDLLEISRIASGKLRLEQRGFDLVALANTAVDSIRPAAEARGVDVERRFSTASLQTFGDPDRLQQVIWNLLSNAVKFTPPGGTVTIGIRRIDGVDELTVSDTGVGIDPAFLPNVFDTFRQADASSTRAHGGLGLGLSIVRHLVESHGGEVRAESAGPDKGATFTVRLPVRHVPPRHVADRPGDGGAVQLPAGRLTSFTVLVVDDDADTREMLVSVLDAAGATVRAAASAAEALECAVDMEPDALVSDIAMPEQDGYSLMQQIVVRLGPRAPRATVALTAFAGQRDRELAFAAGYQRHVTKPFDPVALVALVEQLLKPGESVPSA